MLNKEHFFDPKKSDFEEKNRILTKKNAKTNFFHF